MLFTHNKPSYILLFIVLTNWIKDMQIIIFIILAALMLTRLDTKRYIDKYSKCYKTAPTTLLMITTGIFIKILWKNIPTFV